MAVRDSEAPARAALDVPASAFTALIDPLKEDPWSEPGAPG
ncbi:hypothetical protein [Streptomyces sp. NPDC002553]